MAKTKIAITLDEKLVSTLKRSAPAGNLSALIETALAKHFKIKIDSLKNVDSIKPAESTEFGLTKREYIAVTVLKELMRHNAGNHTEDDLSALAAIQADSLIKFLKIDTKVPDDIA